MVDPHAPPFEGTVVEEELHFTLVQLCRACRAETEQVIELVDEGALHPSGGSPDDWRFSGVSLRRARTALRLRRDLALNAAGAALVLDLLDEMATLQAALRRSGVR